MNSSIIITNIRFITINESHTETHNLANIKQLLDAYYAFVFPSTY